MSIENPAIPLQVKVITFICYGNIIRSIFAEKITHNLAQNLRADSIKFHSAGIEAKPGSRSPENAIKVAKEYQIDLTAHRSTLLTKQLVEQSDMIVCMEEWHIGAIRRKFFSTKEKLFLLSLLCSGENNSFVKYNISDPYGKPEAAFDETFQRIGRCTEALLKQIPTNV